MLGELYLETSSKEFAVPADGLVELEAVAIAVTNAIINIRYVMSSYVLSRFS
jgi:hypothetical protein